MKPKVILDGYFDKNFGDDLIIRTVVYYIENVDFYIKCNSEQYSAFSNAKNIFMYDESLKYDCYVKIIGSGFLVSNSTALAYSIYYFIRDLFKIKKIRMAVVGCNIEAFYNGLAQRIMNFRIKENSLITCRDEFSYKYIKPLLKEQNLFMYPDILFSIPEEWLTSSRDKNFLGISVANRGAAEYEEKLAEISDRFIKSTGMNVILFAFDMGIEADIETAKKIKSMAHNSDKIDIVCYNSCGEDIINSFSQCICILGTRFHSIVLALRMGIPVVPICYGKKAFNMLKDLNFTGDAFSINDFSVNNVMVAIEECEVFKLSDEIIEGAKGHSKQLEKWIMDGSDRY